jgi:galactose mutarotase-like enzyme
MQRIEYQGQELHRWNCGPSTYLADPARGARLLNWNIRHADGSFRDIIHWPEESDFENFSKVRGGNPILFPFAGRSVQGGRPGQWKGPDGQVRAMPQHGFARGADFEIVEADAKGFTAELQTDEAARECYPYDFSFRVSYEFHDLSLRVFLELENKGSEPLPWSAGHHFYFKLPWHANLRRSDYRFESAAKQCCTLGLDGALQALPKGWAEKNDFGQADLSDRAFTKLKGDSFRFGPRGGEEDITIRILPDCAAASANNAFMLWTENEESPFFCVEPWMGPPNAAGHGRGLHHVGAGETARFGVEVSLV